VGEVTGGGVSIGSSGLGSSGQIIWAKAIVVQKLKTTSTRMASFVMIHTREDWVIIINIMDDGIIFLNIGKGQ
jgi:hypothetical protein